MNKKKSRIEFAEALDRRLSGLQGDPRLAQRIAAEEKGEEPVIKKLSASMVLAIVLACVLITGALAAALNGWGILDFLGRHDGYIPENANDTISREEISVDAGHFVCTVLESYYDGSILRMAARVQPKESVMLLEEQEMPDFPMEENEEVTIGEYALQHYNGRMAEVTFYLSPMEDLSGALKRNGDGSANVYMEVYYPEERPERDIVAIISYLPLNDVADKTAEELDSGDLALYDFSARERVEIPIHLQAAETRRYECHEDLDFPEVGVRVTDVVMTVTPLEIRYTLDFTITDLDRYNALDDGLWFEFIDPDSRENDYYAQRLSAGLTISAGIGCPDGSLDETREMGTVLRQHDTIGLDSLREEYTIRAYDAWEKTRYGTATFKVKEVK